MTENLYINPDQLHDSRNYWLNQLDGELTEITLPADFPVTRNIDTACQSIVLPAGLVERLLKISKNNDLSLYVILLTALNILVYKITELKEVIVASPTLRAGSIKSNSFVLFKNSPQADMTFRQLLLAVKETVAQGYKHQHYPVKTLLDLLDIKPGISLFRLVLLLENIHKKESQSILREDFTNDLALCLNRTEQGNLNGEVIYNSRLFKEESIKRIGRFYIAVLNQVTDDVNIPISHVHLISEEEKKQVMMDFNTTSTSYPTDTSLHRLFENRVHQQPGRIALSSALDFQYYHDILTAPVRDESTLEQIQGLCFKTSPYIFHTPLESTGGDTGLFMLKSNRHNGMVVDGNTLLLLQCFNGKLNLYSLYRGLQEAGQSFDFLIHTVSMNDIMEISFGKSETTETFSSRTFAHFAALCGRLFENNIIEPVEMLATGLEPAVLPLEQLMPGEGASYTAVPDLLKQNSPAFPEHARVLLLGDTPGMCTVGLLYLASYLKRHGISACCRFNDTSWNYKSLENDIRELLQRLQPEIVGVSMKWFPHMARVLDTCKIVKEISPDTKVVVGGNSASYYWKEIIASEYVDYVVRGDGEVPLVNICLGSDELPNCVYKKDEEIVVNPIEYVQDKTNSEENFLSHMDEIMLAPYMTLFGTFYIHTQKGCAMPCFYCAGCKSGQKETFNRNHAYRRPVSQVRNDIIEAKKYTSTFQFEFEADNERLLEYCREIWEGIDLSSHFCNYYAAFLPSPELIELVNKTFKYVFWHPDISSLSERHRLELDAKKLVKPQPTDEQIFACFQEWEKYPNCEAKIDTISGLPFFRERDMAESKHFLDHIMNNFSRLTELHWGRLHAQPGAPVVENVDSYDMYTYAHNFDDYLKYSRMNMDEKKGYPTLENLHYPFIYFNDGDFNTAISRFYSELTNSVNHFDERKRKKKLFFMNMTYTQLNHFANRLARGMKEKGVSPHTLAALLLEEDSDVTATILAVLKTGAAYVPIDPDYPVNRILYTIGDSGAKVLLTREHLVTPELKNNSAITLLTIEELLKLPVADSNLDTPGSPSDIAYVIYTSGTTGRAKGVMVEHRSMINYTTWRQSQYDYTWDHVTLQLLSYCFDGFGSNFYSSLLAGGELATIPNRRKLDFDFIRRVVACKKVTDTSLVPGIYEALLDRCDPADLQSLRFVVLAGEKTSDGLLEKSQLKHPGLRLINEYGPTEATVTAAANTRMGVSEAAIIGSPIANTRLYIMDREFNPMPVGVPGELYVTGVGLARGYVNNPQLTHSKFIRPLQHQSSLLSGTERLYCTGDRARWLESGHIEYLGRFDHQVKVRGYRVETGEIEARLLAHDSVKEAVVVALDRRGELGAYWVPKVPEAGPTISQLREYLSQELPAYMIPSHFISLETLPRNIRGKVDYRALPEPGESRPQLDSDYVQPGTDREKAIARIWTQVLELEKVGIHDNFFDLGGNSMDIIKASSQFEEVFGKDIPVVTLFKFPTIAQLAEYLQEEEDKKRRPEAAAATVEKEKQNKQNIEESRDSLMESLQLLGGE